VDAHIARFGHPPDLVAGDRGLQSAANERDRDGSGGCEVTGAICKRALLW
jgi:hypothetical protein